jgi:methionine synthase / methylenetetrahydrofolate reductase(NADPH)
MGSQTGLLLGVEINTSAYDLDDEVRRFESRVKAGAEFAVTQPIFNLDSLEVFLKFGIPLIAGIRPLAAVRDAEYMVHERRVLIPESYMERMRDASNAAPGCRRPDKRAVPDGRRRSPSYRTR